MPENTVQAQTERLLAGAAQEVLETMFFATLEEGEPDGQAPGPSFQVELRFKGSPPGLFRQRIAQAAARKLAAAFLGAESEDGLSDTELENVVRELANVVCGNALSRLESDSSFELCTPLIVPDPGPQGVPATAHCSLNLDGGKLELWLLLEFSS